MSKQRISGNDHQEPTQLDELVEQLEPVLKHITAHRFLWGFTLVCGFVAWNRGLMLLYGLVAFLLAVLLVSHLFRVLNLRGLTLQGRLLAENEPFDTDVNNGKHNDKSNNNNSNNIHNNIHNDINDNKNKDVQTVFSGEPIAVQLTTHSKFAKHFLKVKIPLYRVTQVHTQSTLNAVDSIDLFILHTKKTERFVVEVTLSRGVYRLDSAQVQCGYPFGLLSTEKIYSLAEPIQTAHITNTAHTTATLFNDDLYVLPRYFSIHSMPSDVAHSNGQGELASSKKGGFDEFMDIRPYRRGDAFKSVHWGASARQVSRGKDWMVKEYATFDTPRLVIVLNQFDLTNSVDIDAMLATTLAVAEYFSRIGHKVDLFGYDGSSQSLSDFWQMNMNSSRQQEKLHKLAELDSIANYIYNSKADSVSNQNANSNNPTRNNANNNQTTAFNNKALRTASYNEALQAVMTASGNDSANVLLSFHAHSPTKIGMIGSSLLLDKTQYQVVINRKMVNTHTLTQAANYIKRSNSVHEFTLNTNEGLEQWQAVFNSNQ